MGRFAYVFYATNNAYAIAVMVFVRLLQGHGIRPGIDLVVLHTGVSRRLLARMRDMGLLTRAVPTARHGRHRYYRDCFAKLHIFEPGPYERVVYVDADAVPLASLDNLFSFPLDGPIAAPRAYWLPQPFWGSYLLVVRPSHETWRRVQEQLPRSHRDGRFDMDIINAAFADDITTLPDDLVRLNSDWEDGRRSVPSGAGAEVRPSVIHFTALGKPWQYSVRSVRRLRPRASPLFYEIWDDWWRARDELFAGRPFLERCRHRISKLAGPAFRICWAPLRKPSRPPF